jgi:hypothetical protein
MNTEPRRSRRAREKNRLFGLSCLRHPDSKTIAATRVPRERRNGSAALRSIWAWNRRTVRPVVPGSRNVEINFQDHDMRCRPSHLANIGPVPFFVRPKGHETEVDSTGNYSLTGGHFHAVAFSTFNFNAQ